MRPHVAVGLPLSDGQWTLPPSHLLARPIRCGFIQLYATRLWLSRPPGGRAPPARLDFKGVRIRRALLADLQALAGIEARSFPDPWPEEELRGYLEDPGAVVLLAEDPEPIGFLVARAERQGGAWVVHIHDLAVDPVHRRRGAGRALVQALVSTARRRVPRVVLEVREGNTAAQALYRSLGFRVIHRLPNYYDDGEPALRMELDLAPPRGPASERGRGRGASPPPTRQPSLEPGAGREVSDLLGGAEGREGPGP